MPESYKHYIPKAGLSVERHTEAVPNDGKYYLLRDGEIVHAFRSLKQAEQRFREMLEGLDYSPQPVATNVRSQSEIFVERYLDAKDMYWAESHRFRGKGGRGGRGGV